MKFIANHLVWIGFGFGLFSFVTVYCHKRKKIFNKVIKFTMNWKESWASTLTVFSGILGTLLNPSFFPDPPKLLKSITTFQTLQIFFPILVVIAGFTVFVFNNICAIEIKEKIYSPVWPLWLGSSLVLWAFVGELTTLIVLFEELRFADYFPRYETRITQYLFGLMEIIGICYVIISVGRIIEKAKTKKEVEQETRIIVTEASLP